MSGVAFVYSEAKYCDQLGISRADIKAFRDRVLRPDSDWKKTGDGIALSSAGVKRIWRSLSEHPLAFDLAACLISPPQKKNGAVEILVGHATMPIPVLMTVTRICPNPSVVLGQQTEGLDRTMQLVWVGRNENFVTGMRIKCVPKPDVPAMWRFLGALPQRRYTPDEWTRRQWAGMQG